MTEYVNGRIPKIYSQEGLSRAVQTLQREMNDVQQVMSPQYLKEIEPAFNRLQSQVDALARDVRRVESKLGHTEKAAEKAVRMASGVDLLGKYIEDIHNAFVDDVTARLDALESRHKKPVATQTYPGTPEGIRQATTDAKRWTRGYTGPGWLTMAEDAKRNLASYDEKVTVPPLAEEWRTLTPKMYEAQQESVVLRLSPEPPKPAPVTKAEYEAARDVVYRWQLGK